MPHSPFEGIEKGVKQEISHVSDLINQILKNQSGGGGGGGDTGGGMGNLFDPAKAMQSIESALKQDIFKS